MLTLQNLNFYSRFETATFDIPCKIPKQSNSHTPYNRGFKTQFERFNASQIFFISIPKKLSFYSNSTFNSIRRLMSNIPSSLIYSTQNPTDKFEFVLQAFPINHHLQIHIFAINRLEILYSTFDVKFSILQYFSNEIKTSMFC